jgi:PHD/YefM family antitoxin component YafN of YafNO toxin-antitoxin module
VLCIGGKRIGDEELIMLTLHPNILERNGRKAFAVLPFEEFEKVRSELADYEDLKTLRAAKVKEGRSPTITLANVQKRLGL